jgi:hypothetical protein
MSREAWLKTFPKPQADKAVHALHLAWREMASTYKSGFNREIAEPKLTLVLASYLRDVISTRLKLLGHWGAEDVKAKIDFASGKIIKQVRTDIEYLWNDQAQNLCLVFEFKKLNQKGKSHKHYYGEQGLLRFVTGDYSLKQPIAFMVAVVLDNRRSCITALRQTLQHDKTAKRLSLCESKGSFLHTPSKLFPEMADFDTEHIRPTGKGPSHGIIRISHIFLEFGYPEPHSA